MSADELRKKIYTYYYFLQEQIEEDAIFNLDNTLSVIMEVLNHVEDDHECAKIAIGMYNDLTNELGRENIMLKKENIKLSNSLAEKDKLIAYLKTKKRNNQ